MYESDTSVVTDALRSANSTIFSSETISQILNLTTKGNDTKVTVETARPDENGQVTVNAGTEVVLVASSDTFQSVIKPPVNAPVVVFQGRGGVIATINDGVTVPGGDQGRVDRVVVGSAGNDKIVVADAKNSKVILGSGDSTVVAGGGVDTVVAGLGNSTIVGGSGDYTVVKLAGNATNYQVTTQNGHAVVTDKTTHKTTDISKIQYVELDNGKALIFAKDSVEASVATLYHTTFGRDAEPGGLDYWFDRARAGTDLKQIAKEFADSSEFKKDVAVKDDQSFVQNLYQNTFGRAGDDGGVAYWLDQLAHGQTRADLLAHFSYIAGQNEAGIVKTEPTVIGEVHVVTGII